MIVNKINDLLGNLNTTVDFSTPSYQRQGDERDMMRLIEEMNAGQVAGRHRLGRQPGLGTAQCRRIQRRICQSRPAFPSTASWTKPPALHPLRRSCTPPARILGRCRTESRPPQPDPTHHCSALRYPPGRALAAQMGRQPQPEPPRRTTLLPIPEITLGERDIWPPVKIQHTRRILGHEPPRRRF
ncbi:MAG: hypothetical protein IPL27_08655 [Lewinellaceae bacterium]|nr:hypothetical protein [Lewinellaceae bacterium]